MSTESRARAFDPHCPECLGTGLTVRPGGSASSRVLIDCETCAAARREQLTPTTIRMDGIIRGNADLGGV